MTDWTIASASPTIRPFEARIASAIATVRPRVAAIAEPQAISFTLKADRTRAIPRFGFGGSCYDPGIIMLSFDTKNPNVEEHLGETLERTIAHEYHHALRWAGPGYGAKLGAALASEGLAGHFVRQLYGSSPEPWECGLSENDLAPWRKKAIEMFDARDHGHAKWFFGADGYPPWLGYTLGYDMIGRYLSAHPDRSVFDLAHEPYGAFRSALTV